MAQGTDRFESREKRLPSSTYPTVTTTASLNKPGHRLAADPNTSTIEITSTTSDAAQLALITSGNQSAQSQSPHHHRSLDRHSKSSHKHRQRHHSLPKKESKLIGSSPLCASHCVGGESSSSDLSYAKRETKHTRNGNFDMGIKKSEVMDDSSVIQTVEILKRPGQTLGFYIREGNGLDRQDGVFISRIQMGTVAETNGLLHVADEILTVNSVKVSCMSLDDVVILMSIPKKLVLTIRTRKSTSRNASCPTLPTVEQEEDKPIVVLKKGRCNSASALEMTEKYSDPPQLTSYTNLTNSLEYNHAKTEISPDRSQYASVFISPRTAEARLIRDDFCDTSKKISDVPSAKSMDTIKDHVGRYGWTVTDVDIEASPIHPSNSGPLNYGEIGDQEYLKYTLGEGGYRKYTPKSSPRNVPSGPSYRPHEYVNDDPRATYSYANDPYAVPHSYQPNPQLIADRHRPLEKSARGLMQSKVKYGYGPRSHSPECYNSDSEIASYLHTRRGDMRGFASDHETYTIPHSDHTSRSDDNDVMYAVPQITSSSSMELQQLLHKFNTLSQELQQEQSKLKKQLVTKHPSYAPLSLPRSSDLDYRGTQHPTSTHASPGIPRRTNPIQSSPIHIHRKQTSDPSYTFSHSLDNQGYVVPDYQRQISSKHTKPSGKTAAMLGAASLDKPRVFDTDGKSLGRPTTRYKDLHFTKKPLQINYDDYEAYRADVRHRIELDRITGLDGMLSVHILTGQGLKSSRTTLRDLYCVLAVDNENKARTMIRTGAVTFDWDEAFDIELDKSKELSFLVYNWDPNFRHRLCFHGTVLLPGYIDSKKTRRVGIRMEPKGILYADIHYKEPSVSLQRLPSCRANALFGMDLDSIIQRENSGFQVPILLKKCIDEVEARGLESVGIYRLCGSVKRKNELRDMFERSVKTVDLSPNYVSDIHVITGVLKDYLRELPEPLVTNALYQMLLDALQVRLPDDPDGSATLMLSILDCLPKSNQETLALVLRHLNRVAARSDTNKMTVQNIAVCFGPVLLCPSSATQEFSLDFKKHIEVLKYLLEIWPDEDILSLTSNSDSTNTVVSISDLIKAAQSRQSSHPAPDSASVPYPPGHSSGQGYSLGQGHPSTSGHTAGNPPPGHGPPGHSQAGHGHMSDGHDDVSTC